MAAVIGRVAERRRYRYPGAERAREHALGLAEEDDHLRSRWPRKPRWWRSSAASQVLVGGDNFGSFVESLVARVQMVFRRRPWQRE